MLTLSRKKDESITIELPNGDEILITVNFIKNKRVSVSFAADPKYHIVRTELLSAPTEHTPISGEKTPFDALEHFSQRDVIDGLSGDDLASILGN